MEPTLWDADALEGKPNDRLLVHAWRTEQLRRLGLSRRTADTFADVVDWRAIARLVDRGCPAELALEIVR